MSTSTKNGFALIMKNARRQNFIGKENTGYLMQFDGGSRGNPGVGGCGAVIYDGSGEIWNRSQFVGEKVTNNFAEYMGLIHGMRGALEMNIKSLNVEGDSKMVIKQMTGEYKVKSPNLITLYKEAVSLRDEFDSIGFSHIYRKHNVRADELANIAMDKEK